MTSTDGTRRPNLAGLIGLAALIAGVAATTVSEANALVWTAATPAATPADSWTTLRRPLHLPPLSPGSACPRSDARQVSPHFGAGLGDGPVYAALGPDAKVNLEGARQEGGWFYVKVLWYASPDYDGPILVRGRQLDGAAEVRFNWGAEPADELKLEDGGGVVGAPGWRHWPTYTRLQGPGCYAYQVDGTDFSDVVVFEAVNQEPES